MRGFSKIVVPHKIRCVSPVPVQFIIPLGPVSSESPNSRVEKGRNLWNSLPSSKFLLDDHNLHTWKSTTYYVYPNRNSWPKHHRSRLALSCTWVEDEDGTVHRLRGQVTFKGLVDRHTIPQITRQWPGSERCDNRNNKQNEPRKKPCYFPIYWLLHRNPYEILTMVYHNPYSYSIYLDSKIPNIP